MDEPACIICNKSDPDDLYEIKATAINRVVESSKKRFDHKHKKIEKLTSAHIHRKCQAFYNRQSSIEEYLKTKPKKLSEAKQIIKDAQKFNFASLCFFCGKVCNKYRHEMRFVTNACTKQNIIGVAELRKASDIQCKNVLARLNTVQDLSAENARYHTDCMATFYRDSVTANVGRPASQSTKDFIEHIIQYIKSNKSECQFSANQIKTDFTDDPDYKFPDFSRIKKKTE